MMNGQVQDVLVGEQQEVANMGATRVREQLVKGVGWVGEQHVHRVGGECE